MKLPMAVKMLLLVSFSILISCTAVEHVPGPAATVQTPVIQENLGEQVARYLNRRYADTRVNCGRASMPSFLCTGIMLRGTSDNPTYHVWNNSPKTIAKGGVSFAFIRSDTDFNRLPYSYTNGYIFESYVHAAGKIHPEILCSFPVDGWTEFRQNAGCGVYPGYAGSDACHLKGITTAQAWWTDYNAHPANRYAWQCGFDVRDARNELAGPAFAASIAARAYMGNEGFTKNNEIIIKVWADNLGKTLPLEAFFYISGSSGLPVAQRNQRDLRTTDRILIPIIRVKLAETANASATFTYIASDQTEAMPIVP